MGNCCSTQPDSMPIGGDNSLFMNRQSEIKLLSNNSFLGNEETIPVTFPPAQDSDPFSDNNLNDIELNQYASTLTEEEEEENLKKD